MNLTAFWNGFGVPLAWCLMKRRKESVLWRNSASRNARKWTSPTIKQPTLPSETYRNHTRTIWSVWDTVCWVHYHQKYILLEEKKQFFHWKKNIYFLIFSGIFFQNTARFLNRTLQSRQRCSRRSACNARRMDSKAPILKLLCALGKAYRNLQRYPCFPVDGVYLRASFSVKVSSKAEQKPLPARELRTTGSGTFHPDPPRWQAAPPRRYEQHRWRALQYPFVWC